MTRTFKAFIFLLPALGTYVITPLNGFKAIKKCDAVDEAKEPECLRFCITKDRSDYSSSIREHLRVLSRVFRYEILSYDKESETLSWAMEGAKFTEGMKKMVDNVTLTAYLWKHSKKEVFTLTEFGKPIASCCGVPLWKNQCKVTFNRYGAIYYSMSLHGTRLGSEVSVYEVFYFRYETICPEIKPNDKNISCILLDVETGEIKVKTMMVGFEHTGGEVNESRSAVEICSFKLSAAIVKHGVDVDSDGQKSLDAVLGAKLVDATDYLQSQEHSCPQCNCTKENFRPGDPTLLEEGDDKAKCFYFETESETQKPKIYCMMPPVYFRYETICPEIKPNDKEISCILLDVETGEIKVKTMINTGGEVNESRSAVEICSFKLSTAIVKHGVDVDSDGQKSLDAVLGAKLVDATDYLQSQEHFCPQCNCTKENFRPGDPTLLKEGDDEAKCFYFETESETQKPKIYCMMPPESRVSEANTFTNWTLLVVGATLFITALLVAVYLRKRATRKRKNKRQNQTKPVEKSDETEQTSLTSELMNQNPAL